MLYAQTLIKTDGFQ